MSSLKLEALEQILRRQVVLTDCVRQVFRAWGYEDPFGKEDMENLRVGWAEVRDLLRRGITELAVP